MEIWPQNGLEIDSYTLFLEFSKRSSLSLHLKLQIFLMILTFMFYSMDTCECNHGQQLPIMLLSIFSFQLVTRPVWRLQHNWRHFRNLLEYQKTRGSSFTYRDSSREMASRRISGTRSSSGLRHELIDLSHHLRQERLYVQNEKTQVSLLQ